MKKSLAYINTAVSFYFNLISQETEAIYWVVIAIFWLILDMADKKGN